MCVCVCVCVCHEVLTCTSEAEGLSSFPSLTCHPSETGKGNEGGHMIPSQDHTTANLNSSGFGVTALIKANTVANLNHKLSHAAVT